MEVVKVICFVLVSLKRGLQVCSVFNFNVYYVCEYAFSQNNFDIVYFILSRWHASFYVWECILSNIANIRKCPVISVLIQSSYYFSQNI